MVAGMTAIVIICILISKTAAFLCGSTILKTMISLVTIRPTMLKPAVFVVAGSSIIFPTQLKLHHFTSITWCCRSSTGKTPQVILPEEYLGFIVFIQSLDKITPQFLFGNVAITSLKSCHICKAISMYYLSLHVCYHLNIA